MLVRPPGGGRLITHETHDHVVSEEASIDTSTKERIPELGLLTIVGMNGLSRRHVGLNAVECWHWRDVEEEKERVPLEPLYWDRITGRWESLQGGPPLTGSRRNNWSLWKVWYVHRYLAVVLPTLEPHLPPLMRRSEVSTGGTLLSWQALCDPTPKLWNWLFFSLVLRCKVQHSTSLEASYPSAFPLILILR